MMPGGCRAISAATERCGDVRDHRRHHSYPPTPAQRSRIEPVSGVALLPNLSNPNRQLTIPTAVGIPISTPTHKLVNLD
jgi:hypothetical protein